MARGKSIAPRLPLSPIGFLTLTAFSLACVTAFVEPSRAFPPFAQLAQVGVSMFMSIFGMQVVVGLGGVAHFVEGLYLLRLCSRARCTTPHSLGWFGLALLYGWPAVMEFKSAARKDKTR